MDTLWSDQGKKCPGFFRGKFISEATFPFATSLSPLSFALDSYRYLENEVFGPHYDESSRDESTGHFSEWTLLVYLTGQEDGVEGGETAFYENHSTKNAAILAPLEKGMGLLHRHGQVSSSDGYQLVL